MTPKFNPTAAHHLIASWILTIYSLLQDDHETSTEWQFKGHIYLEPGRWPAGKTYDDALGQRWRSSIYQLFLFQSIIWKYFTIWRQNPTGNCWNCRFKLCTGKIGEPMTVEKIEWSWAIAVARVAHWKSRRRNHKRIRLMKLAAEGKEWNDSCSLVLPMEAIAGRKLPTISWWSVRAWVLYVQIHVKMA